MKLEAFIDLFQHVVLHGGGWPVELGDEEEVVLQGGEVGLDLALQIQESGA